MILTQDARTIDTNVDQSQVFKIKTTAQAFKILSSNLYSNKIRAIVRELSCNAIDSHKLANNPANFEVHLPNAMDPYFSVRDFGVGLSETDVFELYTSYFESTKSQSNDFIGALGLGSKSPFSYVDSFSIESIYNGEKKDYSAYISEAGVPTISLLNTMPCDEHNGIEVKIPVEQNDFRKFKQEAEIVFYAFPESPIIKGVTDFIDYRIQEKDLIKHEGKGWKILKAMPGPLSNDTFARQGCINYPLNDDILQENADVDTQRKLNFILRNSMVIDFPLGSLDIAASREEISYDPRTVKAIVARLLEIYDEFVKEFTDKINSLSLYDAIEYYRSAILMGINYGNRLSFTHASTNVVIDSDSRFELTAPLDYMIAQDNDNSPYGLRLGYKSLQGEQKLYLHPNKKDKVFLLVDVELNNIKLRERIRYYLSNKENEFSMPVTVILAEPDQVDVIKKSSGEPEFTKLSSITLPETPVAWKAPKPRETEPNFCDPCSLHRTFNKTFFDVQSDKPKYYIVNQDGEHVLWKTGRVGYRSVDGCHSTETYWLERLFSGLISLGMFPKDVDWFIVRKRETGYKRFLEDKTFSRFDEFIESHLNDYIDKHEQRIINLFALQKKVSAYQSISILKETQNTRNAGAFKTHFWDRITHQAELKKAYLIMGHARTKERSELIYSLYSNDCMPESTRVRLKALMEKAPSVTDIDHLYPMLKYVEFSSYNVEKERLIACSDYVNFIAKEVI